MICFVKRDVLMRQITTGGSARSVDGFSVLAAMEAGRPLTARMGGHEQAAGCEIRADAIDAFREAVCDLMKVSMVSFSLESGARANANL